MVYYICLLLFHSSVWNFALGWLCVDPSCDVFVAQTWLVRSLPWWCGDLAWQGAALCSCRPLFERLDLFPVFQFTCLSIANLHVIFLLTSSALMACILHDTRNKAELVELLVRDCYANLAHESGYVCHRCNNAQYLWGDSSNSYRCEKCVYAKSCFLLMSILLIMWSLLCQFLLSQQELNVHLKHRAHHGMNNE
jgi:hypothetical protein